MTTAPLSPAARAVLLALVAAVNANNGDFGTFDAAYRTGLAKMTPREFFAHTKGLKFAFEHIEEVRVNDKRDIGATRYVLTMRAMSTR